MWNPEIYARYATERARPFFDLLARVQATNPAYVVDAGCGSGELTVELTRRWPQAIVHGFDSSPNMIEKARPRARERLTFTIGDVRDPLPVPADVIVSNAVLHWVPEHRDLLARWAGELPPGGWLAVQMPGNFDSPGHQVINRLCRSPAWRDKIGDLAPESPVGDPEEYLDLLAGQGCRVDAWETTYLHVLQGENPVLEWKKGTALRPLLARLDPADRPAFLDECAALLAAAYPSKPYGTPFPFRRIFVVAQKTS